jgi:cytoskeletal protein CcmA (bactofilin family)
MRKKGLWLGVLVLLLIWPASVALADAPGLTFDGGRIFVDEDVALESGETFDGDLGVFDGDLTVPQGSVVSGDVFVTNGDVEIGGRVDGSVAVISGQLSLAQGSQVRSDVFVLSGDQEIAGRVGGDLSSMFGDIELFGTAVVEGDLLVMQGHLERESGARVVGEEMSGFPLPNIPLIPEQPSVPESPKVPERPSSPAVPPIRPQHETLGQQVGRFFGRSLTAGFLSLLFIAVGLLVVFVWPRATHRVSECITTMPVLSFGLGLLTFLIAAVLEALAMVLMILIILVAAALLSTVILIPIGLLLIVLSALVLLPVPLALAGGMVLGWVALAELVGRQVLKLLKAGAVKSLGATLVGLLVTVPLAAILWIVKPVCCAWPFIILLTSVGLGAVIHTRFGRQSCRNASPPAQPELLPAEAMEDEAGQPDGPVTGTP